MDSSPTLLSRAGRLLRAKQFLVFYAIGLYALAFVPPLAVAWLHEHHPLADLLHGLDTPFGDLWASPTAGIIAVVAATLLVEAWFTAGYLRSLIGQMHWGPVDGRQLRRLLVLGVVGQLITWGFVRAQVALGLTSDTTSAGRFQVAMLLVILLGIAVNILLLYVNYAIVASDATFVTALRLSWRTVKASPRLSVAVVITLSFVGLLESVALSGVGGVAAHVVPLLVVDVMAMGTVGFLSDVLLLTVYIDSVEQGKVTREQPTLQ